MKAKENRNILLGGRLKKKKSKQRPNFADPQLSLLYKRFKKGQKKIEFIIHPPEKVKTMYFYWLPCKIYHYFLLEKKNMKKR